MADREIALVLRELRAVLLALDIDQQIVVPKFSGSEMFSQAAPEFHSSLCHFASAEAQLAMDKVSYNAYWFLVTAGTTLAVADHLPATADDVSRAIYLQRQLISQDAKAAALLAKVSSGKLSDLTEAEFIEAGRRRFLLIDECGPEGTSILFNPLFL